MYQFYYADTTRPLDQATFQQNIADRFTVTAVRPTMWEEHCIECAAPLCFGNCVHYQPRRDGRCKRFENGLLTFSHEAACLGQGVRVSFRKWANMMTILFPAMLTLNEYRTMWQKNEKRGSFLKTLNNGPMPRMFRWQGTRTIEFLRRRSLRRMTAGDKADAFVFHGYSYAAETFRLILEVFDDHTSVFRTAITIEPGENMHILPASQFSNECQIPDRLVKIYPEQDKEVTLDILWCDFVQGSPVAAETPAAQVKCVVWDLDQTVWNGIFIETDDPTTLALRDGVLNTMKALDERGILQSVASKNEYDAVYPLLEQKGLADYFLYPQIHWGPKSESLKQIAKNLNIGIDSLALIDDSPFERNQVSSELPQVRVYDALEVPDLLHYPECDVLVTADSRRRRSMYRAEEQRNRIMQNSTGDVTEFLRRCHLKMNLFSLETEEQKTRCYELVVRTNQLNMSGKKYTPDEFEAVLGRDGHTSFGVACRDDFGDYGIVGFGQYRIDGKALVFTEFALSCRVAGKYVESALFTALLTREGCTRGVFDVIKTKKNGLLRRTLEDIGFTTVSDSDEKVCYEFGMNLHNHTIVQEG